MAFLPAALSPPALGQSAAAEIVIQHATVIDGTGTPPRRDVTIVIGGGRILSMDRSAANSVKPAPGVRVIDATGEFLVPGLWDMHVHLDAQGNELRTLAANGITGIREMYSAIPIATLGFWRART
jgi:imidazolonepropionase-like amidohydrolase